MSNNNTGSRKLKHRRAAVVPPIFLMALAISSNVSIGLAFNSCLNSRQFGLPMSSFDVRCPCRSFPLFSTPPPKQGDAGGGGDISKEEDDDGVLTDLDARVLQSMLQDEKLNLQEEENMKRLLERGIKNNEPVAKESKKEKVKEQQGEQQYASQILKTLGDTKLWKGFSRNAADLFESAKIWVENKVERDTKLVASLGLFAYDRALQDVQRALPAASAAASKVAPNLFLDATTSANQNLTTSSMDIRNRMLTPQDEIKSVSQEIKFIIQSGGERGPYALRSTGGMVPTNNRGLQSTSSSKRGKDRFLKAYQRRKQTTLRREKENVAQTGARMAGTMMDSAYQVRRELQIEPSQPGYKTKALREGAVQTSKMLASGAKGFLTGARAAAQGSLPSTASSPSQAEESGGMAATDAAMNAAMGKVSPQKRITSYIDADIVDASVVDSKRPTRPKSVADAPINARIPGTSSTDFGQSRAGTQNPSSESDNSQRTSNSADLDEQEYFFASRGAPDYQQDQTVSSLLKDKGPEERASPREESKFAYFSADPSPAASGSTGTTDRENKTNQGPSPPTFTEALSDAMPGYVDATPEIVEAVLDSRARRGAVSSDADVAVDPAYSGEVLLEDEEDEDDILLDDEDPQDTLRRVMAEIVTDEDFESAVGSAKRVDNTASEEVDDFEGNKEPSLLVILFLRFLDVLFLVLEKVILAIPSLLSAVPRIASRCVEIQNAGIGYEGWDTISNAQRGDRRY